MMTTNRLDLTDRTTLLRLHTEITKAIEGVLEGTGCTVRLGGLTYSPDGSDFRTKVEVIAPAADGSAMTKEAVAFQKNADVYGFKPEDLGATFRVGGDEFVIRGFKPRSRKYPIAVTRVRDGSSRKMQVAPVLRALGREVPGWLA